MKVQKLVYFAHGWHLGITKKPLINEQVEAWPYGAVIPSLYDYLKQWGLILSSSRSRPWSSWAAAHRAE